MYNAVKMELYRMVRMKSFYVMTIVMIAMTLMGAWALHYEASAYQDEAQISEQAMELARQEAEQAAELERQAAEENGEEEDEVIIGMQVGLVEGASSDVTVLDAATANVSGMVIAFCIAIFAVLFCGADISSGYIKNFVGQAKSRTRLVLAKAVAMGIYTIGMLLLFCVVQVVSNGIFFGYIHMGDMGSFLSYFAVQIVLHIAFSMICLAIVLISRSTVISMVFTICICWNVLSLLYMGIDIVADKIGVKDFNFSVYTISGRIERLSQTFSRQDCLETLTVAAVYIILTFVLGSVAFTKRDI